MAQQDSSAVRPIPTDRAITRSLAPQAYFRRRTSRTFRIDNLSAGIRPPFATRKRRTLPGSDCRQRSPPHPINRVAAFVRNRWPPSIGLGGRFPSESVAALPRIPHICERSAKICVGARRTGAAGDPAGLIDARQEVQAPAPLRRHVFAREVSDFGQNAFDGVGAAKGARQEQAASMIPVPTGVRVWLAAGHWSHFMR